MRDLPFVLPAQDDPSVGVIGEAAEEKAIDGVGRHVGGAALELAVKRRECDRPLLAGQRAVAGDVDGICACVGGRGPAARPLGQGPGNDDREATRACGGGGDERAGDSCDPVLGSNWPK